MASRSAIDVLEGLGVLCGADKAGFLARQEQIDAMTRPGRQRDYQKACEYLLVERTYLMRGLLMCADEIERIGSASLGTPRSERETT